MNFELINVRTEAGRVGIVTLNRPKQLNALNDQLMDELGEVRAGAEPAPGTGDHQGPDGWVGAGLVKRCPQVVVHLAIKAVERLRTVQRGNRHRSLFGVQHGRVSHVRCLVMERTIYHRTRSATMQEFP